MSFIADVWSKTAGCVSMPGCEEKLALFVLEELTLSGTGLWEVVSGSRHNVITCGVSFMAWLGDKQVIGRRSGVGKIRAACPFMSVSGRDEREDWTRDLVFLKKLELLVYSSACLSLTRKREIRDRPLSIVLPFLCIHCIQRYCCQECSSESIYSLN